jgi:hypothetical protein|tara:strand:- start:2483 stop:2929 length:447 start_codon:yes stop_codon:yes gene_type:complete
MAALGVFGGILFLIVGVIQIFVGYIGIEYHLGSGFAIGALVLGFVFRIMFPLTIGTFFGALDVFGWPFLGALALAAPGLFFIVPALITSALSSFKQSKRDNYFSSNYENESGSIYKNEKEPKNVTPKKTKKTKKIFKKKVLKKRKIKK